MTAAEVVISDAGAFRVAPCPSWCTRPAGHDLTSELSIDYDGAVNRMHSAVMTSSTAVEMCASELIGRGDEDGCEAPHVLLDFEIARQDMTAAQAREIAAGLLEAASLIERVTR